MNTSKIFISYRRDDSADSTGRLFDRLKTHFGLERLVRDVDSIPTGVDFREYLANEVNQCQVLIAVIGRSWQDIKDGSGKRRLDNPHDMVRIEIETALQRNIPIIPVIVAGASFPDEQKLPAAMRGLVNRNGVFVRPDPDFHQDVDRLLSSLDVVLKTAGPKKGAKAKVAAAPASEPAAGGKRWLVVALVVMVIGIVAAGVVGLVVWPRLQGPKAIPVAQVSPTEPKEEKPEKAPPETKDKVPPDTPATPRPGTRGVSQAVQQKAMAWIREANKFGPTKPIVANTAGAVEKHKEHCFIVLTGATLLKSKKTTVIAGRGDSFFLFELTDQQAKPFPPGSQQQLVGDDKDLRLTAPDVVLASPRIENAERNPRDALRGSVDYTRSVKRDGRFWLRLVVYVDKKWYRLKGPVALPADQGSLTFNHPNALAKAPAGPLLVFIELVDESGAEHAVVSNPVAAVVTLAD